MSNSFDAFSADGHEAAPPNSATTRPFDDDGYIGYDPRLPSQRYDSFSAFAAEEDPPKDVPDDGFGDVHVHHVSVGSGGGGGSFPPSPEPFGYSPEPHQEFSSPFEMPEANGGADHDAIFSDEPTLPPPGEMQPEEGFLLREWRRQNAELLKQKEEREKELREQIYKEADEYKTGFYEKRKVNCETNKIHNREREKLFLANQEKFHTNADKQYWKAIAELIPNEVPNIEKRRGKKDQDKKPSIVVIQGPKPGKPTDLSRMRQILLKLKHNLPPHMKPPPPPPAPAPAKDGAPAAAKKQGSPKGTTTANGKPSSKEEAATAPPVESNTTTEPVAVAAE
ncbi:clathrin light chain 2-like [Dioscorea cayenensis subsp. rotundata]|uniref:Clathrin light chain n=1 Tax=Dioscorea cayennensis subsp. rotundata TaxID=55577 RepID=A0AB40C4T2_DIOCR|nr:clathrin light chain 2-like [Dioscorea cayenensis subsp. rotundata]